MSVSTTLNKIIYSGNGATTAFPFTFPAVAPADLQVFFTDANGNVTLLSPSAYTLLLNLPVGQNPTAAGGTVNYNPGSPIPVGTFLTIMRTLPLVQATSLANQETLYPAVLEETYDYGIMVSQQVLEIQSRALIVNVSDPTPNPLPAVASRKNLVLGFDSNGNPIAVSTLPAGTVSSAMAPVVNAASIPTARSLLGLGTMATEGIGLGLQDNGSGSVQTYYPETADATAQTVTLAFHQNIRQAQAVITYTLPLSTTLFNGFGFWVYAQGGAVTLAINAADNFSNAPTGQSLVIPDGSRVFVSTNAANKWYTRGYHPQTANLPANLSISATVASGALTISLLDVNGNAPTATSPILYTVNFNGSNFPRAITTPLTLTVPSGATLGTVGNVPSRIWVALFDNGGTPFIGVYNSVINSNPNYNVLCWNEAAIANTTAISSGSDNAQTWYAAAAFGHAFRIIGYIDSNQPTAGTWSSAPTNVAIYTPEIKKPGDTVQRANTVINGSPTTNSTTFTPFSGASFAFTPASIANLLRITSGGTIRGASTGAIGAVQLSRGVVAATGLIGAPQAINPSGVTDAAAPCFLEAYDLPGAAATYAVQGKVSGSTNVSYGGDRSFGTLGFTIAVEEIQV